jgi:hypothetical protein
MQYYVQNVDAGYVGNCLLWWRKGGSGYTCDLSQAEKFDESDEHLIKLSKDPKFRVWDRFYIDLCSVRMVDQQSLLMSNSGLNPYKQDGNQIFETKETNEKK